MILEYPNSLAILAHLAYKKEQTSFSPVVQSLTTSNVLPSHNALATGRPTFATPTSTPPQSIPHGIYLYGQRRDACGISLQTLCFLPIPKVLL